MKALPYLAALVALVGAAATPVGALAEEVTGRIGWHGEEMPQGLERGETEGEYHWQQDGAVMVYVPAGPFPMGSTAGDDDEQPVHTVYLSAFYIDKHEVSWGRWKRSPLPVPKPPDWGILDDHPVLNVDWNDARAFADWAGKKLPSEAQWEKAARGTDGREYPWGNDEPTFERAIWKPHPIAAESTAPVDCCQAGASPYGVLNLAGNAYEWCEDVYDRDFYTRSPTQDPVSTGKGRYRVLKGGAYVLEIEDLRSAYRYRLLPIDKTPYIGFRTVLPAEPTESDP